MTGNLRRTHGERPSGRQAGPNNVRSVKPKELRRDIIRRYMSRWRDEVGDDFYPAMRLIIPEKDRDRAVYGLKEKVIGRYLVKILKIDRNSDDAMDLLNWKLPGQSAAARNAGDFAGRCYEVLKKRAFLVEPGNLTIAEVNTMLDELSIKTRDEDQLPIMETFYRRMNADEMTWLIRIILRHMRIGATEKTILEAWHPDAETLFNISSSLKRVCWDLWSTNIRLEQGDSGVNLMECFVPQFAQHPKQSMAKMVAALKPREDDAEFWIEEKLDGERMQLHMTTKEDGLGNKTKKFCFFSRKAKDYTYLYGDSFECKEAGLTKYIKDAFKDDVESLVLDGEMVAWNSELDAIVPFGSLKTAAINQQSNSQYHERPFYRVFDILLLNGQVLTRYTLRDRRKALAAAVTNVHRRLEILEYHTGTTVEDIENRLRDVITNASEGLVLKNPRSAYTLGARYDDWLKVKPEYINEFGESLDCLIIGGYYGSGRRGGNLSSFLCGLRVDKPDGQKTQKFLSFFKVGGGMTAEDFANLRHITQDKWHKYDARNPPEQHIVLAGGKRQVERPDMWIKPEDSLVVEVKAASVNESDEYAARITLRFPRFTRFRSDKDWKSVLSVEEFHNVKVEAESKKEAKRKLELEQRRPKTGRGPMGTRKKQIMIAGYNEKTVTEADYAPARSDVFKGLTIYVMTESTTPEKKTKLELEDMVKANGGTIVQTAEIKPKDGEAPPPEILCIADRRTVKVASVEKRGKKVIVKPTWLFDCIKQGKTDFDRGLNEITLPYEPDRHVFYTPDDAKGAYDANVDPYGDSYARDTTKEELRALMQSMGDVKVAHDGVDQRDLLGPRDLRGSMFTGLVFWFDDTARKLDGRSRDAVESSNRQVEAAKIVTQFAGASLADILEDEAITHVILNAGSDKRWIRSEVAARERLPRIVKLDWVEQCWKEHTRIDEERYAVV